MVRLNSGEVDRWVWKGEGLQTFSVSSAYFLIRWIPLRSSESCGAVKLFFCFSYCLEGVGE